MQRTQSKRDLGKVAAGDIGVTHGAAHVEGPRDRAVRIASDFRRAVRHARSSAGLSQAAVAGKVSQLGLRMDASAVTRIEGGTRAVRLEEAWALAYVLELPLAGMLSHTSGPDAPSNEQGLTPAELSALKHEARAASEGIHQAEIAMTAVRSLLETHGEGGR